MFSLIFLMLFLLLSFFLALVDGIYISFISNQTDICSPQCCSYFKFFYSLRSFISLIYLFILKSERYTKNKMKQTRVFSGCRCRRRLFFIHFYFATQTYIATTTTTQLDAHSNTETTLCSLYLLAV